jgi:hypothetical protein
MDRYVYHFKPKNMVGDTLFPLFTLRETHPEIYAEHVKKYRGREDILEVRIPLLDCWWNEVLHLSPLHPQKVIDCWRARGLLEHANRPLPVEVYKVPVALLNESTTVCAQDYCYEVGKEYEGRLKFWHFRSAEYAPQADVGAEQIDYWLRQFAVKEHILWYSHTMHVLAKQTIDTRKCELITCR